MAWQKATTQEALQAEERIVIKCADHKILLIWHQDKPYAVQAQCPHLKLPLKKATITEQCALVCPFHKSAFDLNTGTVVSWSTSPPLIGPMLARASSPKPLCVYPVRIEEGTIWVDVPSN